MLNKNILHKKIKQIEICRANIRKFASPSGIMEYTILVGSVLDVPSGPDSTLN